MSSTRNLQLTRDELAHASRDLASQLHLGRGRTVAMSLPNGIEIIVGFLGAASSAAVSAPLNPSYTASEFEVKRHREECSAEACVC